jgi:hypothetical protein
VDAVAMGTSTGAADDAVAPDEMLIEADDPNPALSGGL